MKEIGPRGDVRPYCLPLDPPRISLVVAVGLSVSLSAVGDPGFSRGRQPLNLPNISEKCTEMKKIGLGGGTVPKFHIPLRTDSSYISWQHTGLVQPSGVGINLSFGSFFF